MFSNYNFNGKCVRLPIGKLDRCIIAVKIRFISIDILCELAVIRSCILEKIVDLKERESTPGEKIALCAVL